MNILLAQLQRDGVMKKNCVAFQDLGMAAAIASMLPDRTIMDMGEDVRPGPYWAVHACDVPALINAGYKAISKIE